jgi:hypothetical protein
MNAIQKTAAQLKECYPKASQSISKVSVVDLLSFTQNFMQMRCLILLSIAKKGNMKSKSTLVKTVLVHSVVLRGRLMQ